MPAIVKIYIHGYCLAALAILRLQFLPNGIADMNVSAVTACALALSRMAVLQNVVQAQRHAERGRMGCEAGIPVALRATFFSCRLRVRQFRTIHLDKHAMFSHGSQVGGVTRHIELFPPIVQSWDDMMEDVRSLLHEGMIERGFSMEPSTKPHVQSVLFLSWSAIMGLS